MDFDAPRHDIMQYDMSRHAPRRMTMMSIIAISICSSTGPAADLTSQTFRAFFFARMSLPSAESTTAPAFNHNANNDHEDNHDDRRLRHHPRSPPARPSEPRAAPESTASATMGHVSSGAPTRNKRTYDVERASNSRCATASVARKRREARSRPIAARGADPPERQA